jgi:hypothetical protein
MTTKIKILYFPFGLQEGIDLWIDSEEKRGYKVTIHNTSLATVYITWYPVKRPRVHEIAIAYSLQTTVQ